MATRPVTTVPRPVIAKTSSIVIEKGPVARGGIDVGARLQLLEGQLCL